MEEENRGELAIVKECAEDGDDHAWKRFVETFGGQIRGNLVQGLLRFEGRAPIERVDELVQEVYCRLLRNGCRALRRFRSPSGASFRGYLASLASNLVVDHLRARKAIKRGGNRRPLRLGYADDPGMEPLETIADTASGPEIRYQQRESRRLFLSSCNALVDGRSSDRDLEILRLAFLEGWTSREIAERFDGRLKPGSIDSIIARQRRRLEERGVAVPRR